MLPLDIHLTEIWRTTFTCICGLYFVDEKQNWPQAMSKCYDVKKQSHCLCPFLQLKVLRILYKWFLCFLAAINILLSMFKTSVAYLYKFVCTSNYSKVSHR